jgi:hypothetical protein
LLSSTDAIAGKLAPEVQERVLPAMHALRIG